MVSLASASLGSLRIPWASLSWRFANSIKVQQSQFQLGEVGHLAVSIDTSSHQTTHLVLSG